MKISILHHRPISEFNQPQDGASIRLQHLCQGIKTHRPDVEFVFFCKASTEGHWTRHIHQHIQSVNPDIVLCCQMEDVARLPSREALSDTPIIVDLYAPRLLESLYEDDKGLVSHQLLQAIDRADAYLITHEHQRDHWNALLRLVGVRDLNRVLVTPLALETQTNTVDDSLTLVGGGRVWPWQRPWDNLRLLLDALDVHNRGIVHWFAPPDQSIPIDHPRLQKHPWTSRAAYRSVLSQASFGLDLNPDSPERYLACAFRHMEFLGCGLSILSANQNILTRSEPKLCHYIDFSDPKHLERALNATPPRTTLKRFQQAHQPSQIVNDLIQWLEHPSCRNPQDHWLMQALGPTQDHLEAQDQLVELKGQIAALEQTHREQTELLNIANQQAQDSTASLLKVSTALEQISAFKNDIAHSWSDVMRQQQDNIQALQAQVTDLLADNAKKSAELHAMDLLRARLENDLQHTRAELERQRTSRWRR
jgi:hypothetical protein